ncbi:NCS2 family permease [Halioxenophilus sp. WMMB6]|uniref:NCS2 family permease n=1 Tax=Halioxenophilus sp. WMMB6 TaxID=3073815 RepID=UPI00295EE388|nr:NCS2 family permease [Halioxenophilus sp. WMMB6]
MNAVSSLSKQLTKHFQLVERETTLARECLAGLTTFGAMSYILAVNPAVLSAAGLDQAQLVIVTALASAIGTLIMALWANLPIALAPGMGYNVLFAQVIVIRMGFSPSVALAMVFCNALLFVVIAVSGVRERIIRGFPEAIKIGIQAALGLFIAWLGFTNSGLIAHSAHGASFASLGQGATFFAYASVLITIICVAAQVPFALLLSIVLITVLGRFVTDASGVPLTQFPDALFAWPVPPTDIAFSLDLPTLLSQAATALPVMLYLFIADFFGVTGTLMALTRDAGLLDKNGNLRNSFQAYTTDGLASTIGALLGTSTIGVFVESAAGISMGGRTGLTALVVALLFIASLFFWPILTIVPAQAIAPALIIVGLLMLRSLVDIDLKIPEQSIPPLLMVGITAASSDLVMSLASGCFVYTGICIVRKQWPKLSKTILAIDALLFVYLILSMQF